MAIEKKKCECGCGRTFLGTARRRFFNDYCRVKWNRVKTKQNDNHHHTRSDTGKT